jgi:hypothetical protein
MLSPEFVFVDDDVADVQIDSRADWKDVKVDSAPAAAAEAEALAAADAEAVDESEDENTPAAPEHGAPGPRPPLINPVLIRAERVGFVNCLIRKRDKWQRDNPGKVMKTAELMRIFLSDAAAIEAHPQFVVVVAIGITMPVCTAPCERGFSLMNLLKSDLRNRLGQARLQDLMRISQDAPPLSSLTRQDWLELVEMWLEMKPRKVGAIRFCLDAIKRQSSSAQTPQCSGSSRSSSKSQPGPAPMNVG